MAILVTGATGFLGRKLVSRLTGEGREVVAVTRSAIGADLPLEGVRWIQCDLARGNLDARQCRDVDVVVHLAGATKGSRADEAQFLESNERTMVGLLRFAADRCSRFVIASSQAVYGDPGSRSVDEDFALDPGDSAYGCSKVNAENWARSFQIRHGGCYLALRLCGFVDGGGLVDYVVDRALKGSPVELFAKGAVCRDYLPSAEGVDALLAATRCPAPEGFMPLNVGSGQALSARQVAEIAIGALGSRSEITLLAQPAPQRDMVFSVERARRVLGFAPGDLAAGVRAHALARAAAPPTEAPR